jgi:hypothetical protein
MMHHPHKNPYAAVWQQLEQDLRRRIHDVHETGVTIDAAHQHLNWRGASAHRFESRARTCHRDLVLHNDTLRFLRDVLIPQAAQAKLAEPTGAGV